MNLARLLVTAVMSFSVFSTKAATFIVTNTLPSGPGSLANALLMAANTSPVPATINFNISGSPPFVISPTSVLNVLYGNVTIDGTTQPGYANNIEGGSRRSGDGR